jgi:hypothetical protein
MILYGRSSVPTSDFSTCRQRPCTGNFSRSWTGQCSGSFSFMEAYDYLSSRYPIVERAVAEVNMLSDQSFMTGIRNSIQKILWEDKAKGGPNSEKGPYVVFVRLITVLNLGQAGVTDQSSPVRPPQSSTPEGPSAIRKALGTGSQRPESAPRSQSPDSMKMSTPEPPEPSNKPTPI